MKKQRITFKRILASVMCLTLFQVNVLAAEEPTKKPPLTYEKAYEMAIKNNSDLNSLRDGNQK